ncbi:MAG: lysophospholipid acyltransferase family protein [Lysobacterales bacterium]
MSDSATSLNKDDLPDSASSTRARWLRYGVRVPLLLWHILIHLPLTLILVSPLGERVRLGDEHLRHRAIRWWSGGLMRIFGFRVTRHGQPLPGAALVVANHLSWLDIELIHSQRAVEFVAKSEISRWPLIGWLARRAGTIYHRRGSTESLSSVAQMMVERLRQGAQVGVFPEGGTTDGSRVRVFHARIFQCAVEAGVPVQPVALRYLLNGEHNPNVPFLDGESFFVNFVRLLGEPAMVAEVHFLEGLQPNGDGRRRLAEGARAHIVRALGHAE